MGVLLGSKYVARRSWPQMRVLNSEVQCCRHWAGGSGGNAQYRQPAARREARGFGSFHTPKRYVRHILLEGITPTLENKLRGRVTLVYYKYAENLEARFLTLTLTLTLSTSHLQVTILFITLSMRFETGETLRQLNWTAEIRRLAQGLPDFNHSPQ
jgi:hypothetical protein